MRSVVLDCPEPATLAAFYAELLGGELDDSDPGWAEVRVPGSAVKLAFQRVAHYVAPEWPDGQPQQVHLDMTVDDIGPTSRRAVELGARVVGSTVQEDGCEFLVHTDPAGHPFCLCHER